MERTCAHKIRRSRLKFQRQFGVGGFGKTYILNHIATALIGRQFFKKFLLAVKYSNTCFGVNLMSRKSKKIAVKFLNINLYMLNSLSRIHQNRNTVSVGSFDNALHIVDSAESV